MDEPPGMFRNYGKLAKWLVVVVVVGLVVWYAIASLLGLAGLIQAGGF